MNQRMRDISLPKRWRTILLFLAIAFAVITLSNITCAQTYTWSGNTPPALSGIDSDIIILSGSPNGTLNIPANKQVTIEGTVSTSTRIALNMGANSAVTWNAAYSGTGTALVNLSGSGEFEVTPTGSIQNIGTGVAVQIASADSLITVSGTVSATSGRAISVMSSATNTTVKIIDGTVYNSATTQLQSPIYSDSDAVVIVDGTSSVRAQGGSYAILTHGDVIIEDGEVFSESGWAVDVIGADVTVNGGTVSTGSGNYSINATNVTINGGTVSATNNNATINASTVTVTGGSVLATNGNAINVSGTGSEVTISGGTVFATTGHAINSTAAAPVLISDGLVFAYGTAIAGTGNVVRVGTNLAISSDGVAVSWNQGAGNTTYVEGTAVDLVSTPSGSAVWDKQGPQSGISYTNGANTGFFPIDGITVSIDTIDLKYYAAPYTLADAEIDIAAALTDFSTVYVINTGADAFDAGDDSLNLFIPSGKTLEWNANYTGSIEHSDRLIVAGGGGTFKFTGGTLESTGTGGGIYATDSDFTIIISGGTISCADSTAVATAGANSSIEVTGGIISTTWGYAAQTFDGDITVSGGFVFAHGTAIESFGNVINCGRIYTLNTPSGNGVVVAWDQDAGNTVYIEGTTTDLTISPIGTATWHNDSTLGGGISYTNGANTGFFPLGVTIQQQKEIISFDILDVSGIITAGMPNNTITLTLPYGTDVTALAPTIVHTGVSVSPASGTAQDFSSLVTYTVTATDGSTKDYDVTVTIAPNTAKDITGFEISGVKGTITAGTPSTIILTLPYGTDVTALVPSITHTGASVSPASGIAQDFTSPVTYTVTADDMTNKNYVVTVVVAPNTAKEITSFDISGVGGTITAGDPNTIILTLPYGTDVASLIPAITHTGSSVSPASGLMTDFTNPVTYTVTADDMTMNNYVVTVTVAPSPAKDITSFEIAGVGGIITAGDPSTIILTLPFGTDVTALTPSITHTGVSVSPANGMLQDFSSPVTYMVTAADTTIKNYVVTVTIAPSPAKDITSFEIAGVSGVITAGDPSTIILTLPFGTDVTALTPSITHTGVSVSPANSMIQDFSSPVTYTVTAADSTIKNYVVTVMIAPSPAKDITSFEIAGVSGIITAGDPSTIILTLPFGTDVTALTPSITHTGVSVSPANSMVQDFSSPVTYTVTAADSTIKNYVVTVTIAPSPAKDITSFEISGVVGTITAGDPNTIILTLPFGTDIAALTPSIVHTGVSISPANGMIQDFSSLVTYTVTAADGSMKDYDVTVMTALSPAKDITSFEISGVTGTITAGVPNTIVLTLPFGTDIAALTPSIIHTGASISPANGVMQDFSGIVTYMVTAADGSMKNYDVTVMTALSPAKDITGFEISGVSGTITAGAPNTIILTLPFGTDIAALTPSIVHTGASISPANGMIQDFSGLVTYTVTAADGSTKDYDVTVMTALSPAKDITSFEISGVAGVITAGAPNSTIILTLPFGTNLAALTPSIVHTGTSISPANDMMQDFSGLVTYTVTAADGSTKDYDVTVMTALSPAKDITSFEISGVTGTITAGAPNTIILTLPFGTDIAALTPSIIHTGASISPANGVMQDFSGIVTYTVTAADGSMKNYDVTVMTALNPAKDIISFEISGVSGTITAGAPNNTIMLTLPNGTDIAALTPTIVHTGVSISPANGMIQDFSGLVTYTVTAADGSTKDYDVAVMEALSPAKDIINFEISGVSGTITAGEPNNVIILTLPYGTDLTALTPSIVHTGVSISPANGMIQDFSSLVTYTVTADDGSAKDYDVTVMEALSPAKEITSFEISGVSGTITAGEPNNVIILTLPFDTDLAALTPSIVHTGVSISPANGVMQNFENPVTYTVTADDGSTKNYVVTVAAAPNPAKDIISFEIAGVSGVIAAGAPNTILLTLPFGTDLTALTPSIVHTGASISPANGMIQDFSSLVTYTVTAADGSTKNYDVTVVAAPNPAKEIISFEISGVGGIITAGDPDQIILTLPFGTDLTALTPSITHTGASISPANGVMQDFSTPIIYTVTAANGGVKNYFVAVMVAPSPAKEITRFEISGVSGTITAGSPNTITLTLPFGTDVTALTPTIGHTGVFITPAGGLIQDFTNPVTYTVMAGDTTMQNYVVTVTVAPSPAKEITRFEIAGVSGTITEGAPNTIDLTLPFGTDVTLLIPTITHTGVSVSPAGGAMQDFTSPVLYRVTAADGTVKNYDVTVTVAPNTAKEITSFVISGVSGTITSGSPNTITLTLPYGTDIRALKPTIVHTGISVSPENGRVLDFSSPVTYTVTAANTMTEDYVVTVSVAAARGGGGSSTGSAVIVDTSQRNDTSPRNNTSVSSIQLDRTNATMTVGEILQLTETITPEDAADKGVHWSSSNSPVAVVDEHGKVTAQRVGTATITVTTNDGRLIAVCEVSVTSTDAPQTGYDSSRILWLILLLILMGIFCVIAWYRERQEEAK